MRTTLAPGDTLRLTAQVMDASGRVLPGEPVTWSTSTAAVASVDANGFVTADSVGATTIIATAGGKQGTADILVLETVLCDCTVVLDSAEVTLIERDDSTGSYVFQVIRGPPPDIEVGSILVGAEDGGYIRRVDQVRTAGDQITVETSVAYVEDAVREGGFASTSFSDEESGSAQPGGAWWGPWRTTYMAPGVKLKGGTCCSLNDLQLQFQVKPNPTGPVQGTLTFTVKDGDIVFSPRVDIGAGVKNFALSEFHTIFHGDLGLDIRTYEVKLSLAGTYDGLKLEKESQNFIVQQRPYATFIGPMPVVAIITKKISLQVTPTVSASAIFTGSFKTGFGVTAGVRWRDGPGWSGVSGASSYFEATPPAFSGAEGTVSVKIAVVPEFSVQFYGVVGPFVNLEPFAEAAATTAISFANGVRTGWDWETKVDLGLNLNLGAKLSLLGRKDLLSFGIAIPIIRPYRFIQAFSDGSLVARNTATGEDIPASFGLQLRPAWNPSTGPKESLLGRNHETSTQDTMIAANDSVTLLSIRSGPSAPHQLRLTGVQGNCAVTNPNPDTVAISSGLHIGAGGAPSDTTFQVSCIPLGDLGISVVASGPNQPSRYRATVLRADTVGTGKGDTAITVNVPADTVLEDFVPKNPASGSSGNLGVTLNQPRRNCAVAHPASRQVVILSADTVGTGFGVVCVRHGAVRISTATVDPDPDPSAAALSLSYLPTVSPAAAIDSVLFPPGSVGANDSAVVPEMVPLYNASGAPGRYTVALTGAPNRCVESGHYQRPVTVFPGDTAVAGFGVRCVERLHVRTTTTGPGADVDGYLVVVDNADGSADTIPAGINQVMGIPGVTPGDHFIHLADVEPTCVAPAGVTRTVSGRDSTLVSFVVTCPAPAPPGGLHETLVEATRIDLAWNSAGPDSVVGFYRIYRNNTLHDSSATTSFSDPGLPPFTLFSYQVSTVNDAGLEGARSRPLAVRTRDGTPPSAPAGLVATPVGANRIDLSWQAASDPETGIARYRIFRDGVLIDSTAARTYANGGLAPGTTYTYTVSAVNGEDLEGTTSAPASATTPEVSELVDLVVETATSGRPPASYTVVVQQGSTTLSQIVAPTGTVQFTGLIAADYTVTLDLVPQRCTVTPPNPRTVTLPPGSGSVTTAFAVSCPR